MVVLFAETLAADLQAELEARVRRIEWGQWAKDGVY